MAFAALGLREKLTLHIFINLILENFSYCLWKCLNNSSVHLGVGLWGQQLNMKTIYRFCSTAYAPLEIRDKLITLTNFIEFYFIEIWKHLDYVDLDLVRVTWVIVGQSHTWLCKISVYIYRKFKRYYQKSRKVLKSIWWNCFTSYLLETTSHFLDIPDIGTAIFPIDLILWI